MSRIRSDDLPTNSLADDMAIDPMLVSFTIRWGNAVVFHNFYGQDFCLDEASLRQDIDNIKERKQEYFTEKAWQRSLSIYKAALAYLLVNQER